MPKFNKGWMLVAALAILGLAPSIVHSAGSEGRGDAQREASDSQEPDVVKPPTVPRTKPRIVAGPVETRRVYEISVGPWTHRFAVPESVDLLDIADRLRGFIGMLFILGIAVFLSEDRRAISRRVIFWGLLLQWSFALLVLRVPAGVEVLKRAGTG